MAYKYNQVLLIEDEELDNFILQKFIQSTSFSASLLSFRSGRAALEHLKESPALPQVFFIDLNLPLMNGFQFIETLLADFPQAASTSKLVVLTNSIFDADEKKAKSIFPDLIFLRKPMTAEKLATL